MDSTKLGTAFTYEKARESIEAIVLIGLIGHFTGYRPSDNDDETEDAMVALGDTLNNVVKDILEETDKEVLHEIIESIDDGMDVFKKELINVMKKMETV